MSAGGRMGSIVDGWAGGTGGTGGTGGGGDQGGPGLMRSGPAVATPHGAGGPSEGGEKLRP